MNPRVSCPTVIATLAFCLIIVATASSDSLERQRIEESKRKGGANDILKIAEVCDWCGMTFGLDYQCRKNLGDRRHLCMMAYYGDKNGAYKRSARMKRKFNDILKVAEVCDWCGQSFGVEFECRKDLNNKQTLCFMAYFGDKNGAYKRSGAIKE